MRHAAAQVTEALYPGDDRDGRDDACRSGIVSRPDIRCDGLTLTVPLALLNQIDAARLTWLVPG